MKNINEKKFSKRIPSTNSIEEAMRSLLSSQDLLFQSMMKTNPDKDNKQFHVQKPEFVPEWPRFQKYEIFKENLKNWDQEHQTLSDSNKFGKLISSLSKNKEITGLAKLASGKISETLMNIKDKNIAMIIEILDEKYLQTRSERYEVFSEELEAFKIGSEDSPETAWEKFCKLRSSLVTEKIISDLFLHTIFFKACIKSQKIKRDEEYWYREILEKSDDETVHKMFKDVFTKQKIIGKRAATNISKETSEERVLLCAKTAEDTEDVRFSEQRGRS